MCPFVSLYICSSQVLTTYFRTQSKVSGLYSHVPCYKMNKKYIIVNCRHFAILFSYAQLLSKANRKIILNFSPVPLTFHGHQQNFFQVETGRRLVYRLIFQPLETISSLNIWHIPSPRFDLLPESVGKCV